MSQPNDAYAEAGANDTRSRLVGTYLREIGATSPITETREHHTGAARSESVVTTRKSDTG